MPFRILHHLEKNMARSRKASETSFSIYCWFVQVLMVLSLAAVVIWLSTRPRNPKFTITGVHFQYSGNRSFTKGNGTISFDLEIKNPNNGMKICYSEINVKLYNGGVLAGGKSLGSSFCQGLRKSLTEEVVVGVDREFRAAGLRVTVETMVKYQIFSWKTKGHHMGFEGFMRVGSGGNFTENVYLHKIR